MKTDLRCWHEPSSFVLLMWCWTDRVEQHVITGWAAMMLSKNEGTVCPVLGSGYSPHGRGAWQRHNDRNQTFLATCHFLLSHSQPLSSMGPFVITDSKDGWLALVKHHSAPPLLIIRVQICSVMFSHSIWLKVLPAAFTLWLRSSCVTLGTDQHISLAFVMLGSLCHVKFTVICTVL